MKKQQIIFAIEALLFASGDSLSTKKIAEILDISEDTAILCAQELYEKYKKNNGGIIILNLDNSYQMTTNSPYSPFVKQMLQIKHNSPLSQASFEVLAIIAYNQPVTKAFVEQIRGVSSSNIVNSLMQKGLVEEKGRLDLPGRPLLYGTTLNFLKCFGMQSLNELPPLTKENCNQQKEDKVMS